MDARQRSAPRGWPQPQAGRSTGSPQRAYLGTAELEDLLEDTRERVRGRLEPRERIGELIAGGSFLAAAMLMAVVLPWERSLPPLLAVELTVAYALASRIKFELATSYTVPTQLLFVPMLFLLPTPVVPLFVVAGKLLGELPDHLRGARHPERAVMTLGDSWYAVGPALVLIAAGATEPELADWPVYVAALGAQFGFDFTASTCREWFELGQPPASSLRDQLWISAVDALLSPIGLLVALDLPRQHQHLLLLLPLIGLLAIFAHERRARLQGALDLKTAYQGMTVLLADLIERVDKYTGIHSRGIVSMALGVADDLSVAGRRRRVTQFAALLHDVGKISVPPDIINKRGPLTDEEWERVRLHTIDGQRMLEQVGGLLGEVGQVVRSSHERWDGRGYPDGLAGEEIPLEARIVSCCDAFHAMTTHRPYRRAVSTSEALGEIRSCAGTQFDPLVVEILVRTIARQGERNEEGWRLGGEGGGTSVSRSTTPLG